MTPATGSIALNNYLQNIGKDHLLSWLDVPSDSGTKGHPDWTCTCKYNNEVIATATGTNKYYAHEEAAEKALEILKSRNLT